MYIFFLEYDDFNAVVGSLDEQECISPTDANTWIFDRARGQSSLDNFLSTNEDIQEEEESEFDGRYRRDSENYQIPVLNDVDKAKLMSCIEEIRNIIGDSCSDKRIVDAVMVNDFDFTKALDMILSTDATTGIQLSKKPKVIEVEKGKRGFNAFVDEEISQVAKSPADKSRAELTNFSILVFSFIELVLS